MNVSFEGLEWKEFTIKEPQDEVAAECAQYHVVAFSCYIWNITQTLEVATLIKAINPSVHILLGGPEVSYEWEDVIAHDAVDSIITGEGEIPFREFLTYYPELNRVSNLVYKQDGEIRYRPAAQVFDLHELADIMPYQYDDPLTLANKVLYIETSRGCPYHCEFCLASLDNKVRYLPDESIRNTLLFMMQHGRVIKFLDRTFNIKKDFSISIFKWILQHHRPGNVFQFEITADIVHPDIITFIQEQVPKGLFRFEIGIQTVNQKANLAVGRKQHFEKTRAVIEQLQDYVELHLDLIVGLAHDYISDIEFSFEEVFRLFAPELQLGFLKFLKGTPVRASYREHGFEFDPMPPYQIISSNYLSVTELARITQLENALEIYWNRKRALHTLKYIATTRSSFQFLADLGAYFEARASFHQHTFEQIFSLLYQFAMETYPDDTVLHELIAIDYFLYPKIKPAHRYIPEWPVKERNALIEKMGFDHHRYRHALLSLHFDFLHFSKTLEILDTRSLLIIQYTGTEKPVILTQEVLGSQ